MKILGIVAEYNPFHNGHKYHLEQAKVLTNAEYVVAVMSGDFTQRGEPACLDKWTRAQIAVENGIDLVLELPFAFACNYAQEFAYGGVSILNGLGCVTDMAFGCESGNLRELQRMATLSINDSDSFDAVTKSMLLTEKSYPAARAAALKEISGSELMLIEPNDILAFEYLRALAETKSVIRATAVKRADGGYRNGNLNWEAETRSKETNESPQASASALRAEWSTYGKLKRIIPFISEETAEILQRINMGENPKLNDFTQILFTKLRTETPEALSQIYACNEGLENRIFKLLPNSSSVAALISVLKTKRYPTARLSRLLIQSMVGLDKESYATIRSSKKVYGRILGLNEKGAFLIKNVKENGNNIPLFTNLNKELNENNLDFIKGKTLEFTSEPSGNAISKGQLLLLKYDILASDLFHLAAGQTFYQKSDFVQKPYFQNRK